MAGSGAFATGVAGVAFGCVVFIATSFAGTRDTGVAWAGPFTGALATGRAASNRGFTSLLICAAGFAGGKDRP